MAVGEGNVARVDEFGLRSRERPRLDPATGATGRVLESDGYVTSEASAESDVRIIRSSEDGSVADTLAQEIGRAHV